MRRLSTSTRASHPFSIPAAYYRGGTSRAIFFQQQDLPQARSAWDDIFRGALGSPDPYGRQLNGIGGGISSLSKICVVAPSEREGIDVDFTFCPSGREDWRCGLRRHMW
ncbi:PrpF domain-containing protein [Listeria monocytogenes]|uniref:PrpF domain-containing protein n=1 Tax=Listeria monocytogenes TaxID=1639 RepID=UPI003D69A884